MVDNAKRITGLVLLTCIGLSSFPVYPAQVEPDHNVRDAQRLLVYYRQLSQHKSSAVVPDFRVILHTLRAIDRNLPRYFPDGPFTRTDLIAIAMLESDFHQHEVGTSGERGIFQIMQHNVAVKKDWDRMFNIDVNTRFGVKILSWKFEEQKNYKMAIIAYNGLVRRNGKLSERYWRAFLKNRYIVTSCLGEQQD